jgi:hypothetical protein
MPEKGQSPYLDMPDIHIGETGVLKLYALKAYKILKSETGR